MVKKKLNSLTIEENSLLGHYLASDIIDEKNGKIFYEAGFEIDEGFLEFVNNQNISKLHILRVDNIEIGSYIRNTLQLDKARSREEALFEVFKILRPGEPPTIETAELLFNNLFFNADRYDLSSVGRLKINSKFKKETPIEKRILDKSDILDVIKHMHKLIDGIGEIDDISVLENSENIEIEKPKEGFLFSSALYFFIVIMIIIISSHLGSLNTGGVFSTLLNIEKNIYMIYLKLPIDLLKIIHYTLRYYYS